jgi:hypothetical protein
MPFATGQRTEPPRRPADPEETSAGEFELPREALEIPSFLREE